MVSKLRIAAALAAVVGLTPIFSGPAAAQAGVQVGTLTCNSAGGWGFIFGSTRALACTFSGPSQVEYYRGEISKFGVDIGYSAGGVLVWAVFAPTAQMAGGSLSGAYAGGTASATVGVGVGANALIGGSGNHIVLQPVSIEGSTGLNVAAGVAAITLSPAR
jgi:hypothetical protein